MSVPGETGASSQGLILGELGALLLDAGVSVTDVRGWLEKVRDTSEVGSDLAFSVLPEMVVVSDSCGAARVVTASQSELSFRQAALAGRLVRQLASGTLSPTASLPGQIAEIRQLPRRYRTLKWIAGSALVAGGLAVLSRCPWWAVVVSLLVGGLVAVLVAVLGRLRGAMAVVPFVAAFVSTAIVGAIALALQVGPVPLFAVCAPAAIMVPGGAITNALLELTAADIVTGAGRLVHGLIVLGFMSAGIAAGAVVTRLHIDSKSAALIGRAGSVSSIGHGWVALPPPWFSWVGVLILACGVGIAFESGRRLTAVTVVTMVGTFGCLALFDPLVGSVVAAGATAGALLVATRVIERLTGSVPSTALFQPAFLLLVPGTVGLVALARTDAESLRLALLTFASLCVGIKVGSLSCEAVAAATRSRGET